MQCITRTSIEKGTNTIVRPRKRAKRALSNISTPVISDAEDDPATDDQASIKTGESIEVIEVRSNKELDDLEKILGPAAFYISFLSFYLTQFNSQRQPKKGGGLRYILSSNLK